MVVEVEVRRRSICRLAADNGVVVGIGYRCHRARAVRFEEAVEVREDPDLVSLSMRVWEVVQEALRGSTRSKRACMTYSSGSEVEDGVRWWGLMSR